MPLRTQTYPSIRNTLLNLMMYQKRAVRKVCIFIYVYLDIYVNKNVFKPFVYEYFLDEAINVVEDEPEVSGNDFDLCIPSYLHVYI